MSPIHQSPAQRTPSAEPQRPAVRSSEPEVKPWRPAAHQPVAPAPGPEVKPWRPAQAQSQPAARPVSFPSVSRETEEKKKWWAPKEG